MRAVLVRGEDVRGSKVQAEELPCGSVNWSQLYIQL